MDEVVQVGTLDRVKYEEHTKPLPIPKEEVRVVDDTMFEDESRVEEGAEGSETIRETYTGDWTHNYTLTKTETISRTEPKPKTVYYGTKELYRWEYRNTSEPIEPSTTRQADPDLYEDETRVEREGTPGENRYLDVWKINNRNGMGERTVKQLTETVAAVDRIERYGTKVRWTPDVDDLVVPYTQERAEITDYQGKLVKMTNLGSNGYDYSDPRQRSVKWLKANLTKEQLNANSPSRENNRVLSQKLSIDGFSKEDMDHLERLTDMQKVNEIFLGLLNEERRSQGLEEAKLAEPGSFVRKGAETRANEMADYGSLRYGVTIEGKHRRPNALY